MTVRHTQKNGLETGRLEQRILERITLEVQHPAPVGAMLGDVLEKAPEIATGSRRATLHLGR